MNVKDLLESPNGSNGSSPQETFRIGWKGMVPTSPNGSNGSSPQETVEAGVGEMEIDGIKLEYREENDEIQIFVPDDIPEEQKKSLEGKAEEVKLTLAAAKRKAMEVNRERDELAKQKAEIEAEKEALRKEREMLREKEAQSKSTGNALLDAFGVETWDEVSQLHLTNPQAYHEGLARFNAENASKHTLERVRNSAVADAINNEGYDANDVQRFAKAKGIGNLDVAFDYYKRVNDKPKGVSLADLQKKSVSFVPRGQGTPAMRKEPESMKDMLKDVD